MNSFIVKGCFGFEFLTAVTMKSTVSWVVTPCSSEGARKWSLSQHCKRGGWLMLQSVRGNPLLLPEEKLEAPSYNLYDLVFQAPRSLFQHWHWPFKTHILLAYLRSFHNSLSRHLSPVLSVSSCPCYHRRIFRGPAEISFRLLPLARSEPHTDNCLLFHWLSHSSFRA
jgi:hypothetical protein